MECAEAALSQSACYVVLTVCAVAVLCTLFASAVRRLAAWARKETLGPKKMKAPDKGESEQWHQLAGSHRRADANRQVFR